MQARSSFPRLGQRPVAGLLRDVAALALTALGLTQMVGAVLEIPWLVQIGRASVAAPAPLGFSHVGGVEPFALRLVLEVETHTGRKLEHRLDRSHFERLRGPLNRRYIYIRGLFYGVGLGGEAEKRAVYFGLCVSGALAREFGIDEPLRRARVQATALTAGDQRSYVLEVQCAP